MISLIKNKYLCLSLIVLMLFVGNIKASEPVPGAEILIEQEPNDVPVMKYKKTDHLGTYHFKNLKKGTYKIVVKNPYTPEQIRKMKAKLNTNKLYFNFVVDGIQKSPITFGSKTGKNPLLFESPTFELTAKVNSFLVKLESSPNNYGINDEGIK